MPLKRLTFDWVKFRPEVIRAALETYEHYLRPELTTCKRQDRKVEGYTPRPDRAKKVRMLISTAFASYYDWPGPEPEDGSGAAVANRLRCGGAGI
jgi:hypothetical protein